MNADGGIPAVHTINQGSAKTVLKAVAQEGAPFVVSGLLCVEARCVCGESHNYVGYSVAVVRLDSWNWSIAWDDEEQSPAPPPIAPGYWQQETTGVLRPAVEAYLRGEDLTPEQLAAMRAYLRQWICAPIWAGVGIEALRHRIDGLTTMRRLRSWLRKAVDLGCDPL